MIDLTGFLLFAWPFLVGVLTGAVFFAALWWTVRQGMQSERPALLFIASWFVRTGLAVLTLWWVAGDDVRRWLAATVGFMAAQLAVRVISRRALPSSHEAL